MGEEELTEADRKLFEYIWSGDFETKPWSTPDAARATGLAEKQVYESLSNLSHVAFHKPDPDRIRREFWQGEPTYARLFALFQSHYAEREGKPRWGDQTGLVERYADQIFAAYPDAQMIHMLRDPRDRYEASLALWPHGNGRVGGATARWRYTASLARPNQRRYPERYLVVRRNRRDTA